MLKMVLWLAAAFINSLASLRKGNLFSVASIKSFPVPNVEPILPRTKGAPRIFWFTFANKDDNGECLPHLILLRKSSLLLEQQGCAF
jgi:hypothetical protein